MENFGRLLNHDSGAFKDVAIYQYAVIKTARSCGENSNYISIDDAKEMSQFYDEENNFRSDWVNRHNSNLSYSCGSEEENQEELTNEFNFIKRYKHLKIFTPIIWGTEYQYAMRKAKTFYDFSNSKGKILSVKTKEIHIKLLKKLNQVGIKVSLKSLENLRIDNLIEIGVNAKLSSDTIANDLFQFARLHSDHHILGDMHRANVGVYRGHVVTFDAGRINSYDYDHQGLKSYMLSCNKSYMKKLSSEIESKHKLENSQYYRLFMDAIDNKTELIGTYPNGEVVRFIPVRYTLSWRKEIYFVMKDSYRDHRPSDFIEIKRA